MITTLLAAFLLAHGLIHFAIWLPRTPADPTRPAPFIPEHSAILTRTAVPETTARKVSSIMAVAAGGGFLLTGLGVASDAPWAVTMAVLASVTGLVLKTLFFNPWLLLGIALDLGILVVAATWPWS
jgi:hypothetical protein